jgi:NADH-quinone oxidoreductase subunit E
VTRDDPASQAGGTVPPTDPNAALVPEVAPPTLTAPRDGVGDNLQAITGVGPKLEALLHDMGFWHYDQIAAWSPGEIAWVNSRLGAFRGRIEREHWADQARKLMGR